MLRRPTYRRGNSGRASLSPPPPRRAHPWGAIMPRPRAPHPRPLRGNVGPRRATPPTRPAGRQPRQVPRPPSPPPAPGPRSAQFPIVRGSAPSGQMDSPRVMPETACNSWSWKWWPGTESNHRHADFQSNGEPGSVRVSRRPGTSFRLADRTALTDRAHAEPNLWKPA